MIYKSLLLLTFLFSVELLFSQNLHFDITKANNHYNEHEYKEAKDLYYHIYVKTSSQHYLSQYLKCLYALGEYKQAEKIIKNALKKRKDVSLKVELGYLYKRQGKFEQSDKLYQKTIEEIPANVGLINLLARNFIGLGELKYAEKTYKYTRGYPRYKNFFHDELANIYRLQRDYERMLDEYFWMLDINGGNLPLVQNKLQYVIGIEIGQDVAIIIKKKILNKIQNTDNNIIYNELLAWLYMQMKEFENAATTFIALDKRTQRFDDKIISLAVTTAANLDYDNSIKLYNYIWGKGPNTRYYLTSLNGLLATKFLQLFNDNSTNIDQFIQIDKDIDEVLVRYKNNLKFVKLIEYSAKIKAYKLQKEEDAIKLLKNIIAHPLVHKHRKDLYKTILGDIYLKENEIWEALLLYAQVEKDNKNSVLGDQAQFKKARLSYYIGDVKWARNQLDVLKSSTSKLISNNSFKLSLLITNNLDQDSTNTALKLFSKAELLHFQQQDSLAFSCLDSILNQFENHRLADDILLLKAKIVYDNHQPLEAIKYLEELIHNYSYGLEADDAILLLANIYENNLKDIEKAKSLYQKLLLQYTSSILSVEARRRINQIKVNQDR